MIQNISAINTNFAEGRLLMAAMAKLTTESQTDKTPEEVLGQLTELANQMYKDKSPLPNYGDSMRPGFEKELETLINKHSKENGSNTPDFILAQYMVNCLSVFNNAIRERDNWYGGMRSVINDQAEKWEPLEICKCQDQ